MPMVGFVLALGIANLLLGYLAAAALTEPPLWSGWSLRLRRRATPAVAELPAVPAAPVSRAETPVTVPSLAEVGVGGRPTVAGLDELPAGWLVQLSNQGIVAHTFVEAAAHVLRLDVNRYRDQLLVAEARARALVGPQDAKAVTRLADELRLVNQNWLDKQTAAADMLGDRSGRLGDHEQVATALEQALLDQAAQIRAACEQLTELSSGQETANQGKQLIEMVASLLLHVHGLRDRITDMLATLIRAGETVETLPPAVQKDGTTGLPNRIGLENVLGGWWNDDPQRTRMLSAVLLDIDRFGRINQRLGTQFGDRSLAALATLIQDSIVKDQGFERLIRIAGDKFLVLQGDTGPHQALSTAERLRQAVEATTFEGDGQEFDLTISCGVIEVGHTESIVELLKRAQETMRFAKKAGRNRCALDKGEGPAMLDPPQFPVKARTMVLAD
jgi:diguanylate cyclase (GGDEF)-like protein